MRMPKRIDALTYLPRLLRLSPAILFLAAAASSHAGSSDVRHVDASRISVTAVGGDVDFTMAGNSVTVEPDTTVLLPARIVTGHDGTVGLTQAGTNVSVASDTDVEIPAEAVDGNLIARLIQHRGNVFYDVAPRDLGKLRVETPLLVAVIKGTQFNVAVQPDSTTISLFEGRLEVRTPDSSDVVQLDAGEIAIRSVVDGAIRVVGMNDERAAAPRAARAAVAARTAPAESALGTRTTLAGDAVDARDASVTKPTIAVGAEAVAPAPLAIDARVAVGSVVLDVGLDAEVDVGRAAVDVGLGTEVDLGSTAVDVGLDTGLDVGSAAVEVGLDAAIDVGDTALDAGLDTGVNLGGGIVDANLEAGLDLGADIADAAVDTTVELGGSLDAGLDVADASPGAGVTLDVDTLDLGVDAGLDVGVLDVGLDVDLGGDTLDLGLGGADDTAPEPEPPPPPRLLGGLLGLP